MSGTCTKMARDGIISKTKIYSKTVDDPNFNNPIIDVSMKDGTWNAQKKLKCGNP